MEIDTLHLRTAHLSALRTFYADTLDCSVTNADANEFTIEIGTTDVMFSAVDDGSAPVYHFAINIPQNQFADAVTWLSDRVELLSDAENGEQEIFFED
jgi:catechol-2,3-dioxygenase